MDASVSEPSALDVVAKYFYFFCLDEQISFSASLKVLSELRAAGAIQDRSKWISVLHKWKPKLKQVRGRSWQNISSQRGFLAPKDFDFSGWSNFLSSADPNEIEAVLLSKILNFRDGEIAIGLDLTVGTVRYRVGRGLRRLGSFLES